MLLRVGVGIATICLTLGGLLAVNQGPISIARDLAAAIGGGFLLIGLWTPVVGALTAVDELWIAVSAHSSQGYGWWIHVLLAVLTVGIAMLGPGAWSIDARLFGRKRFDIGN